MYFDEHTELKPITLKNADDDFYDEDVERIQKALASIGRSAVRVECIALWEKYSESMAAGWMCLPDTDEGILNCIFHYYE